MSSAGPQKKRPGEEHRNLFELVRRQIEVNDKESSFRATVLFLAIKIAKSDGVISRDEIVYIKKLLKISDMESDRLNSFVKDLKNSNVSAEFIAATARDWWDNGANFVSRENVLKILAIIAWADGNLDSREKKLYFRIATQLRITHEGADRILENARAEHQRTNSPRDRSCSVDPRAWTALGLEVDAGLESAKRAYKIAIKKYHPDRFASQDIPQDMIDLAEHRLKEARWAYENIEAFYRNGANSSQ
ncbi:MAG: TerB family tellurite resistance protein [Pseudomonadota bacterium]